MVSGVYRVDYATTARAICQTKECKEIECKIRKNTVRVGVLVEVPNNRSKSGDHATISSLKWRHFCCMTAKTLENMKSSFSDDIYDFDGFDEISKDDQAKFKEIFDRGQVIDGDIPDWLHEDRQAAKVKLAEKRGWSLEKLEEELAPKPRGKKKTKADEEEAGPDAEDQKKPAAKAKAKAPPKKKPAVRRKRKADDSEDEAELSDAPETPEPEPEEEAKPKKKAAAAQTGARAATSNRRGAKKVKAEEDDDAGSDSAGGASDGSSAGDDDAGATSDEEVMPKGKDRRGNNGTSRTPASGGRARGRGAAQRGATRGGAGRVKKEEENGEDD